MKKIATLTFLSGLVKQCSWGSNALGTHESSMDLYVNEDLTEGFIEWDIPGIEETEHISFIFENGHLVDYDGVSCLPMQAAKLLECAGFRVSSDFL